MLRVERKKNETKTRSQGEVICQAQASPPNGKAACLPQKETALALLLLSHLFVPHAWSGLKLSTPAEQLSRACRVLSSLTPSANSPRDIAMNPSNPPQAAEYGGGKCLWHDEMTSRFAHF